MLNRMKEHAQVHLTYHIGCTLGHLQFPNGRGSLVMVRGHIQTWYEMTVSEVHTSRCLPRSASCLRCFTWSMLHVISFSQQLLVWHVLQLSRPLTESWLAFLSGLTCSTVMSWWHQCIGVRLQSFRQCLYAWGGSLLVRDTIPASRISSSGKSLNVSTSLVLAVLNSSTSEDKGSCSLLLFPYSPILVRLGGIPSLFLRCPLLNWVLRIISMAISVLVVESSSKARL